MSVANHYTPTDAVKRQQAARQRDNFKSYVMILFTGVNFLQAKRSNIE